MKIRRARRRVFLLVPIAVVFCLGSCTGTGISFDVAAPLALARHRPRRPPAAAGPVFVRGEATRAALVSTPGGKEGVVAWEARVGRLERSNKKWIFKSHCSLALVDGLVLETRGLDEHKTTLRGWDASGAFVLRTEAGKDRLATIHFGAEYEKLPKVPDDVKKLCPNVPADSEYQEIAVMPGEQVEASGCVTDGVLSPCRDEIDIVTTARVRDLVDDIRKRAGVAELFAAALALFGLAALATIAASARVRATRTETPS